ncbi:MAG: arylesterase [bacterium]
MTNNKIQMTNEIQNPNVQKFNHLGFDIDLTFELWHLTLALVIFFTAGCGRTNHWEIKNSRPEGINIICFGDSITEGLGTSEGWDYPSLLSKKLGLQVINAGIGGDTTEDAIRRLQRSVLERNPKIVIVEFGGNDALGRTVPMEKTFENLELIITRIQEKGALVLLLGIQPSLMGTSYKKRFVKIAKKHGALVIPNIYDKILGKPDMMSDHIHPSEKGYELIAEQVYALLKQYL